MGLFDIIREIGEMISSPRETQNPSIFTRAERDRCRDQIVALCGHGLLEEVIGQPHTYEANGIRFRIVDGCRVVAL